jgi:Cu-processing system permease protein
VNGTVFVIARLTFREAIRRRIATAALVLGGAFLLLYLVGFYFIQRELITAVRVTGRTMGTLAQNEAYSFLTMAGLYAINFLAVAMGALLAADALAGEINSGTIQAIVTKPVRRAEIVLGKWLGYAGLLGLYLLLTAGGVVLGTWLLSNHAPPHVERGLALIYLESLLIMSITLACSSRFSALATGGVVFGLYGLAFVGGWVEQIGALLQNETAINIGILSSLISPSEALWKRAAYEMTSPLVQSVGFSPFSTTSVPSPVMVAYAVVYLAVMVFLAVRTFGGRDL